MGITFSAVEVLEMAEKAERDGAAFYRKAAELFHNSYIHKLFLELIEWESKHEEKFREMRSALSGSGGRGAGLISDEDLSGYLRAMKGLAVFDGKTDNWEITGKETMKDVLRKAMRMEKASIVYYKALKAFVPSESDRLIVDDVIREEARHIRIIRESLEALL